MQTSSKLVFFGNERLVSGLRSTDAPVLRGLIDRGYNIVAIVSNYSDGTSRSNRKLEVAEIAHAHQIPLLIPNKPSDVEDELKELEPDGAILVAYGKIVPQRIIDLFGPTGIINIHPSLLPKHRGPTPIESTIISGDKTAGVSIMQLTAGMDEGPVFAQRSIELQGKETKYELYDSLSHMGAELLFDILPSILSGELIAKPQKNSDVSYTSLLTKQDGVLDPITDDAYVLERKVRAHLGFPKSRLPLNNNDVIVTMAKVVNTESDYPLTVACKDSTWLAVTQLTAPSGKSMSGEAYLRGYAA